MNDPRAPREPQLSCSRTGHDLLELGGLLADLGKAALRPPERIEDGYRLRLPHSADVEATLEQFVRDDKACCPFLTFSIEREPDAVELEVTGPPEARDVLDQSVRVAAAATGQ